VGIDLVPLPKDNENSLDDFFIVDLDDQKLPKFDNKFDLIVLGDVLEHLKRPDIILKNLKELLASHGRIIISVPNIAQIKIRLKLLLGNFDYQDYGIMDRTHLKFFTQKTIKNLIIQAGYQIEREEFIFSKKLSFMGWVLRGSLLNIFYRLFSGQFIFKIRPSQ
jgi:2-polyprenyl-3-methyl-5-hydroxy-6-metoxy-1,4-benzoquinol methylase